MSKIEIPSNLVSKLGPEMKMDIHWIDVKLRNGVKLQNLVVRGGRYITGYANSPNGESELDFKSEDIADIRRHKTWSLWPIW